MNFKKVKAFFDNDRYAKLSGIELDEASPGYAKASMKVVEKHLNAAGVVQGGAIFTLADFAFAVASNTRGQLALAIQVSISFVKGKSEGTLHAVAKELTKPGKLGNYEVKVTDCKGDIVALFNGMVYRKRDGLEF